MTKQRIHFTLHTVDEKVGLESRNPKVTRQPLKKKYVNTLQSYIQDIQENKAKREETIKYKNKFTWFMEKKKQLGKLVKLG